MADEQTPWVSDAVPSLPEPLDEADGQRVAMGGFCFTPLGLRIDINDVQREDLLAKAFKPPEGFRG
jgi:hypothetical protein